MTSERKFYGFNNSSSQKANQNLKPFFDIYLTIKSFGQPVLRCFRNRVTLTPEL